LTLQWFGRSPEPLRGLFLQMKNQWNSPNFIQLSPVELQFVRQSFREDFF